MDADAHRHPEPGPGQLLDHLQVDHGRLIAAAELLRVGQRQEPRLAQRGEHLTRKCPIRFSGVDLGQQFATHQVAGEHEQISGLLGR